jgi:hypothetical protein
MAIPRFPPAFQGLGGAGHQDRYVLYEVLMELTQPSHSVAGFSRCQPRFERLGDFRLNACAEDARRASDDARESRYNADKLYSKAKEAVGSDVDGEPWRESKHVIGNFRAFGEHLFSRALLVAIPVQLAWLCVGRPFASDSLSTI